jgi:hypothetical protein
LTLLRRNIVRPPENLTAGQERVTKLWDLSKCR